LKKSIGLLRSYFRLFWSSNLLPLSEYQRNFGGVKFSFQRLFNLGILEFLPTLVQETPYPAQSNCEGAWK